MNSDKIFHFARALYLADGSAALIGCIPPEESLAIMGASIALADEALGPEYALSTGIDEDGIAYWAEFLLETTTDEHRADWAENAREVIESGPETFLNWADWVFACANRYGLVASGDLASAVKALKSESDDGRLQAVSSPESFRALLLDVPSIARLYAYAFGHQYWATRGL